MKTKSKVKVSVADDYASLEVGDLRFYYGYEETYCKKHGTDVDVCHDKNCYKYEDCFIVIDHGKMVKEVMRIPASKLCSGSNIDHHADFAEYLLAGIGEWIKQND